MHTIFPSRNGMDSGRRTEDSTRCQPACSSGSAPHAADFSEGVSGFSDGNSGFASHFDSGASSDAQLAARALTGDRRAGDEFAARYRRFIYVLLRRYNLRIQDREDISQEVYARLWQNNRRGIRCWQATGMREFTPYLSVIVRNLVHDYQRVPTEILWSDLPEWFGKEGQPEETSARRPVWSRTEEETPGFDDILLRKERWDTLWQAIARLSARDQALVSRRYFAGQSYQAIGTALGMTTDNVGVTLAHIRKRLRRHLSVQGIEVFEEFATTPNQGNNQHKTRRRGTGEADGHGNGKCRTDRGETD